MGDTVAPSANFDDSLPRLATGIPKLQNDIFEIWLANQIGVKRKNFPVFQLGICFYKNLSLQHIVLARVCPPQSIFPAVWLIQSH